MLFVGREKETKLIVRALEAGKSVILQGPFGIGRTALARHVAEVVGERWVVHFVDFSQTPREMCAELAEEFSPGTREKRRKPMRYKAQRFRLLRGDAGDGQRRVIVFDNVARLTHAKAALLRRFAEVGSYRMIAIAEPFLPERDREKLRTLLMPSTIVSVGHLSRAESRQLLRSLLQKRGLRWDEAHLAYFAEAAQGYPLGIVNAVKEKGEN